jgi:NAD(P)H-dependent flavin oxidoreductase YrpB (nitropropane dioxygenase family)
MQQNQAMRTAVTDMFGIEFPILAFSHCRDVVAAVTKAGGLGVLGATAHSPEALGVDLKWIQDEVRGAPFGVDVLLPVKHDSAPEGTGGGGGVPQEHRDFVNQLLADHGLDPLAPASAGGATHEGFLSLTDPEGFAQRLLEVAFDFPIALVASALGPPPPSLIESAKTHDVRVAALAGKVQHAQRHAAAGVDLIVAQGYEAGGHTGEIATMVLIPEVVDAVAPIPVVAAGGIGRGRQIAASLALGAEGVWCGSVWLTTEEAETDPVVKEKFLVATSADTVRSRARTGKPARQLRSAWTDAWDQPGAPAPLPLPTQARISEPSIMASQKAAAAGNDRARQLATYFVGQVVGSMNQVKPTRRVMLEMVEELIEATEALDAKLNG